MLTKRFKRLEGPIVPGIDIGDAGGSGLAQRAKTCRVLGFPLLDKPDPLSQDLVGVLVTPGVDQSLDQESLVIRQNDVARRHDPRSLRMAQYANDRDSHND